MQYPEIFCDYIIEVMNLEDTRIVELYFQRNEEALTRSYEKYGGFCLAIAQRILSNRQDSEECVNDTWLGAWNTIPPTRPQSLSAFFGRITRNLAVDKLRRTTAAKRGSGEYTVALSELDECVPAPNDIERKLEEGQIASVINRWLGGLPREKAAVFILRYFYLLPLAEISQKLDISGIKTASILHRLRLSLRSELEKEEIPI